jgi:uncharacterized OB-fold protein
MSEPEKIIRVEGLPLGAGFNWSVGVLMEKFMNALAQKKLLAAKCPACGYVVAPPRTRCPRCNARIGEPDLIELSGKGKIIGRAQAQVELDGKCNFRDLKEPKLIGAIKLDGADSTIFMPIEPPDPAKLPIGASVSVQWNDQLKGEIADIRCFKREGSE